MEGKSIYNKVWCAAGIEKIKMPLNIQNKYFLPQYDSRGGEKISFYKIKLIDQCHT